MKQFICSFYSYTKQSSSCLFCQHQHPICRLSDPPFATTTKTQIVRSFPAMRCFYSHPQPASFFLRVPYFVQCLLQRSLRHPSPFRPSALHPLSVPSTAPVCSAPSHTTTAAAASTSVIDKPGVLFIFSTSAFFLVSFDNVCGFQMGFQVCEKNIICGVS
jgi:hypothetical protein